MSAGASGPDSGRPPAERTGRRLQRATIGWNVAEVGVTIALGVLAGSLALVAFGLDSLIEVFASLVVLWHMSESDPDPARDRLARRLVAVAFALLAVYLLGASTRALLSGAEPDASPLGIAYLAVTALVMFALASWKGRVGRALASEPYMAEAHMTFLDGWLAVAILVALGLNALWGWWWADPLAAAVVGVIAAREAMEQWTEADEHGAAAS